MTSTDDKIDAWEITPHYDPAYDSLVTDDGSQVAQYVQMVAESWMDNCPPPGEELVIRVKVLEVTRHEYEEMVGEEP